MYQVVRLKGRNCITQLQKKIQQRTTENRIAANVA